MKMERGRHSWRLRATAVQLLVLALWAWPATCAPRPDSPEADTPTRANALEMLLLTPRSSSLPSIVVLSGGSGPGSSADLVNYYIPVIMAEMAAPVSTRDPSVIRVTGCRQGFMEDQSGGCRPIFNPTPYYPRSTRPNRHTSVASILPMIRSPPRVPRPEIQTQRDLIRQFSRRRPAWFKRGLADSKDAAPADAAPTADAPAPDAGTDGPSPRTRRKLVPVPVSDTTTSATDATTTTTTISSATPTSTTTDTTTIAPSTTTVDCDD